MSDRVDRALQGIMAETVVTDREAVLTRIRVILDQLDQDAYHAGRVNEMTASDDEENVTAQLDQEARELLAERDDPPRPWRP